MSLSQGLGGTQFGDHRSDEFFSERQSKEFSIMVNVGEIFIYIGMWFSMIL
jgi:hypothetical protein